VRCCRSMSCPAVFAATPMHSKRSNSQGVPLAA